MTLVSTIKNVTSGRTVTITRLLTHITAAYADPIRKVRRRDTPRATAITIRWKEVANVNVIVQHSPVLV
jgi:hypothetical protein